MSEKMMPGTVVPYKDGAGMFSVFEPMIEATGGLTLAQVCAITGLEYSSIQNWVKRGFVPHPIEKKYLGRHLARIMLICILRDSMKIDTIGDLMRIINGDTDDESDDIISEEGLYDYFCTMISDIETAEFSREEIMKRARDITMDYEPPDEEARERLASALTIMTLAYISGQLIRYAENDLEKLKEKLGG